MPKKKPTKKIESSFYEKSSENKLNEIRIQLGLKISELDRLSDVSRRTIKDIEEGRINSTPETKNKIVNGLNKKAEKKLTFKEVFPND